MTDEGASADGTLDVDRRSPEETFGLLADDIRVGILEAMGETPDEPLSFSDLRERVGVRDSGQFNYHLSKLVGSFVRKVDDDAGTGSSEPRGYELTYAGRQIVGAMYAGTYTANATVAPIELDDECPLCESTLVAAYADETATIECTECAEWYNEFDFPPGSLDQFSSDELPFAFDRWMSHVFRGVLDGFCETCAGRMAGHLVVDEPADRVADMAAHVEFECRRCGSEARASGATPMFFHPCFEGFCFDHGFDTRSDPSWRLWAEMDLPSVELLSANPPRIEVSVTHDDESFVAVVEADATVSDVERRPKGP